MTWIKVASKDDIQEGSGKELNINGQRIALFVSKSKYYAIEALCRHQDGSLAPGKVNGEIVECPLPNVRDNYCRVKVLAAPMCTEFHAYRDGAVNEVLGHEA